jgi:ketopantoate reductase
MRIAIVGTGGIGAPLGASLATAAQDVVFLARGAHLAAIRTNGLRVEGDRGETVVRPVEATDDPAAIGPVDLVLFCVKLIHDICRTAGIEAVLSSDIRRDRWEKFIGLVAISGLCALTRRPIGDLRDDPDVAPLIDDAMQEVVDVGRSCGMQFAPNVLDPARAMIRGAPPYAMPSMAVDLRAGNRLELPWLAGRVVQLGATHGVPTPVNRVVYAALKLYANGAPA